MGVEILRTNSAQPAEVNPVLVSRGEVPIAENERWSQILKRSFISLADIASLVSSQLPEMKTILSDSSIAQQIEIDLKYEGYISRELEQIARFSKLEGLTIPSQFDFQSVKSLSTEGRERLRKVRPRSIGQAARISGVTSSDVSVLTIHLRKR
jgi:tRNA uridine 5-carboxymethylaminomethyl modification enzyme